MYSTLKRIFIGPPIPSSEEHHQRLAKKIALAVFASDAISSTAYATEEILIVLIGAGGYAAFADLVPISIVVLVLLAIVVTSYRQTIYAYPSGGGAYIVSRENLGPPPARLSGVEAVSNGVPAFRRPEPRNASITLVWMGIILGGCFFGLSVLAHHLKPIPQTDGETVLSIMGTAVFGDGTFMYYLLQFSTFAILILAANTAYADFPRLSSIIARDGYLPRQLSNRGDRLVFSNGVLVLAILAGTLIAVFGGKTNALIPLYAVGVFTSFTLSQAGMVRHHQKEREPGWRRNIVINGVGAFATGVVLVIVAGTKFSSGAWVPIVIIPLIIALFKGIKRHYSRVADALRVTPGYRPPRMNHTVVVLV